MKFSSGLAYHLPGVRKLIPENHFPDLRKMVEPKPIYLQRIRHNCDMLNGKTKRL